MENNDNKNVKKSEKVFRFIQKYGMIFWLAISLCAVALVVVYIHDKEKDDDYTKYTYVSPQSEDEDSSGSKRSKKKTTKKTTSTKKKKSKKFTTTKVKKVKVTTVRTTKAKTTKATVKPAHFPVEINSVTKEELLQINGVGESLAEKILAFRRQTGIIYNMDLLLEIDGLGEKKLENLKHYLYVDSKYYREIPEETDEEDEEEDTEEIDEYEDPDEDDFEDTDEETESPDEEDSAPKLQKVNINKANAKEISEKLLIDISTAEDIVILRNKISFFKDPKELLYVDKITKEKLNEIIDYIEL